MRRDTPLGRLDPRPRLPHAESPRPVSHAETPVAPSEMRRRRVPLGPPLELVAEMREMPVEEGTVRRRHLSGAAETDGAGPSDEAKGH